MKYLIRTAAVAAAIALASLSANAGPFGFQKGMTKEQVINMLGRDMIREVLPDAGGGSIIIFNTAPAPAKEFTSYSVVIGKDDGVLKVIAATSPITSEAAAPDLYKKYVDLKASLAKDYGTPSATNEPEPVDGITKELQDRSQILSSYWTANESASFNGDVTSVMLKAVAISPDSAILVESYELTGFKDYLKQETPGKNGAL